LGVNSINPGTVTPVWLVAIALALVADLLTVVEFEPLFDNFAATDSAAFLLALDSLAISVSLNLLVLGI
jgi:hypothetical protein